ncbi:hypothetical protein BDQ12DRAFT_676035 [Crucibulum laeve]|uniref:Uncharacterized protein n=1 Tax=Crucibulum laeve TaxID=68775 RepID=A0A5C3MMF9_9AGAR|nr:hypothetical protein BDQ12DRAFT_676035 [Crucibulum laeve]
MERRDQLDWPNSWRTLIFLVEVTVGVVPFEQRQWTSNTYIPLLIRYTSAKPPHSFYYYIIFLTFLVVLKMVG